MRSEVVLSTVILVMVCMILLCSILGYFFGRDIPRKSISLVKEINRRKLLSHGNPRMEEVSDESSHTLFEDGSDDRRLNSSNSVIGNNPFDGVVDSDTDDESVKADFAQADISDQACSSKLQYKSGSKPVLDSLGRPLAGSSERSAFEIKEGNTKGSDERNTFKEDSHPTGHVCPGNSEVERLTDRSSPEGSRGSNTRGFRVGGNGFFPSATSGGPFKSAEGNREELDESEHLEHYHHPTSGVRPGNIQFGKLRSKSSAEEVPRFADFHFPSDTFGRTEDHTKGSDARDTFKKDSHTTGHVCPASSEVERLTSLSNSGNTRDSYGLASGRSGSSFTMFGEPFNGVEKACAARKKVDSAFTSDNARPVNLLGYKNAFTDRIISSAGASSEVPQFAGTIDTSTVNRVDRELSLEVTADTTVKESSSFICDNESEIAINWDDVIKKASLKCKDEQITDPRIDDRASLFIDNEIAKIDEEIIQLGKREISSVRLREREITDFSNVVSKMCSTINSSVQKIMSIDRNDPFAGYNRVTKQLIYNAGENLVITEAIMRRIEFNAPEVSHFLQSMQSAQFAGNSSLSSTPASVTRVPMLDQLITDMEVGSVSLHSDLGSVFVMTDQNVSNLMFALKGMLYASKQSFIVACNFERVAPIQDVTGQLMPSSSINQSCNIFIAIASIKFAISKVGRLDLTDSIDATLSNDFYSMLPGQMGEEFRFFINVAMNSINSVVNDHQDVSCDLAVGNVICAQKLARLCNIILNGFMAGNAVDDSTRNRNLELGFYDSAESIAKTLMGIQDNDMIRGIVVRLRLQCMNDINSVMDNAILESSIADNFVSGMDILNSARKKSIDIFMSGIQGVKSEICKIRRKAVSDLSISESVDNALRLDVAVINDKFYRSTMSCIIDVVGANVIDVDFRKFVFGQDYDGFILDISNAMHKKSHVQQFGKICVGGSSVSMRELPASSDVFSELPALPSSDTPEITVPNVSTLPETTSVESSSLSFGDMHEDMINSVPSASSGGSKPKHVSQLSQALGSNKTAPSVHQKTTTTATSILPEVSLAEPSTSSGGSKPKHVSQLSQALGSNKTAPSVHQKTTTTATSVLPEVSLAEQSTSSGGSKPKHVSQLSQTLVGNKTTPSVHQKTTTTATSISPEVSLARPSTLSKGHISNAIRMLGEVSLGFSKKKKIPKMPKGMTATATSISPEVSLARPSTLSKGHISNAIRMLGEVSLGFSKKKKIPKIPKGMTARTTSASAESNPREPALLLDNAEQGRTTEVIPTFEVVPTLQENDAELAMYSSANPRQEFITTAGVALAESDAREPALSLDNAEQGRTTEVVPTLQQNDTELAVSSSANPRQEVITTAEVTSSESDPKAPASSTVLGSLLSATIEDNLAVSASSLSDIQQKIASIPTPLPRGGRAATVLEPNVQQSQQVKSTSPIQAALPRRDVDVPASSHPNVNVHNKPAQPTISSADVLAGCTTQRDGFDAYGPPLSNGQQMSATIPTPLPRSDRPATVLEPNVQQSQQGKSTSPIQAALPRRDVDVPASSHSNVNVHNKPAQPTTSSADVLAGCTTQRGGFDAYGLPLSNGQQMSATIPTPLPRSDRPATVLEPNVQQSQQGKSTSPIQAALPRDVVTPAPSHPNVNVHNKPAQPTTSSADSSAGRILSSGDFYGHDSALSSVQQMPITKQSESKRRSDSTAPAALQRKEQQSESTVPTTLPRGVVAPAALQHDVQQSQESENTSAMPTALSRGDVPVSLQTSVSIHYKPVKSTTSSADSSAGRTPSSGGFYGHGSALSSVQQMPITKQSESKRRSDSTAPAALQRKEQQSESTVPTTLPRGVVAPAALQHDVQQSQESENTSAMPTALSRGDVPVSLQTSVSIHYKPVKSTTSSADSSAVRTPSSDGLQGHGSALSNGQQMSPTIPTPLPRSGRAPTVLEPNVQQRITIATPSTSSAGNSAGRASINGGSRRFDLPLSVGQQMPTTTPSLSPTSSASSVSLFGIPRKVSVAGTGGVSYEDFLQHSREDNVSSSFSDYIDGNVSNKSDQDVHDEYVNPFSAIGADFKTLTPRLALIRTNEFDDDRRSAANQESCGSSVTRMLNIPQDTHTSSSVVVNAMNQQRRMSNSSITTEEGSDQLQDSSIDGSHAGSIEELSITGHQESEVRSVEVSEGKKLLFNPIEKTVIVDMDNSVKEMVSHMMDKFMSDYIDKLKHIRNKGEDNFVEEFKVGYNGLIGDIINLLPRVDYETYKLTDKFKNKIWDKLKKKRAVILYKMCEERLYIDLKCLSANKKLSKKELDLFREYLAENEIQPSVNKKLFSDLSNVISVEYYKKVSKVVSDEMKHRINLLHDYLVSEVNEYTDKKMKSIERGGTGIFGIGKDKLLKKLKNCYQKFFSIDEIMNSVEDSIKNIIICDETKNIHIDYDKFVTNIYQRVRNYLYETYRDFVNQRNDFKESTKRKESDLEEYKRLNRMLFNVNIEAFSIPAVQRP